MARTELTQLGQPSALPASPDEAVLDRVPNPQPDTDYVARFAFPEFTCICPVTGQPDFAHHDDRLRAEPLADRIEVAEALSQQVPQSRRVPRGMHGGDRQAGREAAAPKWLRIGGYFYPRGGMPIDVFWQTEGCRRTCGCRIRACRRIGRAAKHPPAVPLPQQPRANEPDRQDDRRRRPRSSPPRRAD